MKTKDYIRYGKKSAGITSAVTILFVLLIVISLYDILFSDHLRLILDITFATAIIGIIANGALSAGIIIRSVTDRMNRRSLLLSVAMIFLSILIPLLYIIVFVLLINSDYHG